MTVKEVMLEISRYVDDQSGRTTALLQLSEVV